MRIYEHILAKYAVLFGFLIFLDQFSKYLIRSQGGFYVCNKGIAWGISINIYLFVAIWSVIVFILLLLLFKPAQISNFKFLISNKVLKSRSLAGSASGRIPNSFYVSIPILLILAGAVSNGIDRIFFGCVVDFIDLKFWPVFNLADAFVVLGAIFWLVRWRKI